MPLNPDNNLYSVAPVGHVIVIGRQAALKGGITRDSAVNLLAWLILSTNAKPDEIGAAIAKAFKPTAPAAAPPAAIVSRFQVPATVAPSPPLPVAGQNVAAFMGEIDSEEQQALDEVAAACATAEANTPPAPTAAQPAPTPPAPAAAPVVALPARTAAPVPYTPGRPTIPAVTPFTPPAPTAPVAAPIAAKPAGAVDEEATAKAWGVGS